MKNNTSKEYIAFYNVENLFLPDPPQVHKSNPTPSGLRNWDERKYRSKISKITHVVQLMEASEEQMPLAIALAEVQGRKPLEELVSQDFFKNYQIVHYASGDQRGMDVALLYDKNLMQLLSSDALTYSSVAECGEISGTRDVLHCKFGYSGSVVHIFVLHLPSKRDRDINKYRRAEILAELQKKVAAISGTGEAVILCGDFNANPDDSVLQQLLYDSSCLQILNNPFLELFHSNDFSTFHHANGLLFDQMILSDEFYHSDFPLQFKAAKIFSHEKLRKHDRRISQRPARTFAGTRYLGGYSDHFPVITEFIKN